MSGFHILAALDDGTTELQQAMAVLRAAGVEPETLPLGTGDRMLLELSRTVTGRPIELVADCPACGTSNEVSVDESSVAPADGSSRWFGPGLGVRAPTYGDLASLPTGADEAIATLAAICSVGPVPPADALSALGDVDQSLSGPIDFACVSCGGAVSLDTDVEAVALAQLREHAVEVDREVHALASAYKWDLATIESLSDRRRHSLARLAGGS